MHSGRRWALFVGWATEEIPANQAPAEAGRELLLGVGQGGSRKHDWCVAISALLDR